MNLKKIIAAAMVGALSVTAVPIFVPGSPSAVISQAEAARGGARIAPKAAPSAPKPHRAETASLSQATATAMRRPRAPTSWIRMHPQPVRRREQPQMQAQQTRHARIRAGGTRSAASASLPAACCSAPCSPPCSVSAGASSPICSASSRTSRWS